MSNVSQYGVKETGEILDLLGTFGTITGDVAADGKVTFMEVAKYLSIWDKIAPAVENAAGAVLELGDLDSAEREDLKQRFAKSLKLHQAVTEELLEEGADLGLHLIQFIAKIRQLRTAQEA